MRVLFIALTLLAATACKNKSKMAEDLTTPTPPVLEVEEVIDEPQPVEQIIYYNRSACFGTCPSFTFEVFSDGQATYHGRNFVDMIGSYKGKVDLEKTGDIYVLAQDIGYFQLDSVYDNKMVTDLPGTTTIIFGKSVMNRYQGPDLDQLYKALDALIEDTDWGVATNQ